MILVFETSKVPRLVGLYKNRRDVLIRTMVSDTTTFSPDLGGWSLYFEPEKEIYWEKLGLKYKYIFVRAFSLMKRVEKCKIIEKRVSLT